MAKPTKKRPIRMDQFVKQLEEAGIEDLETVEVSQDESVYIRLGVGVDIEKTEAFMDKIRASDSGEETALVILGEHPTISAEEQREKLHTAGWKDEQLIAVWGAATADMRDTMGKLRPKRS